MGRGPEMPINEERTKNLVIRLCKEVNVPLPVLTWDLRAFRGCYKMPVPRRLPTGRIIVGPKIRDGINAVLHEVAHHVVAMRQPRLTLSEWKHARQSRISLAQQTKNGIWRRAQDVQHGPVFVETLAELAKAWYGESWMYAWSTDYPSVYKMAYEAGFARKEM